MKVFELAGLGLANGILDVGSSKLLQSTSHSYYCYVCLYGVLRSHNCITPLIRYAPIDPQIEKYAIPLELDNSLFLR